MIKTYVQGIFALFLLSLFAFPANAQYKTKQVLIANGGVFGSPGNLIRIGSYDPSAKKYTIFDSVPGNSVTQILTEDNIGYMATDSYLVKYDIDQYKKLNTTKVRGLRRLAFYKDFIVASIGSDTSGHLKIFKKSDLSLVYTEKKDSIYSEGVAVIGDSAYVALQGEYPDYNFIGSIMVVDLVNQKYVRTIKLDSAASGIGRLFASGNTLVGVTEYPTATITVYDTRSGTLSMNQPGFISGAFDLIGEELYANFGQGIGHMNISTFTKTDKVVPDASYAGAAYDSIGKLFYFTSPSYSSPGKAYVAAVDGTLKDSFAIGISPEAVAVDYRSTVSLEKFSYENKRLELYPNPAADQLYINLSDLHESGVLHLSDVSGRKISSRAVNANEINVSLSVSDLKPGIYLLNIATQNGNYNGRFVKQ
jgi:hypothetical protein